MRQILLSIQPLLLAMLTAVMTLTITSCIDNIDNPVTKDGIEMAQMPDETQPTDDQMAIKVTVPIVAAVPAAFDEGTTGAALVKRLPQVTTAITSDTRLVLLKGSDFSNEDGLSGYDFLDAVRVLYRGGYIGLVRPTGEETAAFSIALLAGLVGLEMDAMEQLFDIDKAAATRAAQHSAKVERMKARTQNLKAVTRADDNGLKDVIAELLIFSGTDYFMQQPLQEQTTSFVHSADDEGNETAPETVITRTTHTPFISGQLADAAAEWLNEVEKEPAAARRAVTRASGSSAVNELMDASETFTYSGAVDWRDRENDTRHYTNRVLTTIRSWGVHSMESNKDYYYVKQNVTLRMGDENGWKIFYPTRNDHSWYDAENYGKYDCWYGSFLSQYETSMNLTGSGNIMLEASVPSTDNNSQTSNVTFGSSVSRTETVGISWGTSIGANAAGPMASFNISNSSSVGTTTGSSFSMSMSQTHKDFGVKKNTVGSKVVWTYNATLPQYYESSAHYHHQLPADILVNDCDVANEICWSVGNPSGQYTLNITSAPQTAAIVFQHTMKDNAPHQYEYTTAATDNYTHTLIEPNRAMQTWRMNLTIDAWEGTPVVGAQGELESNIRTAFPDLYANVFKIADKTATSLNTITYIVNNSKQIFGQRLDILQSYAKSWGIRQFTIHWSCDDINVKTREGFTVKVE